MIYIGIDPGIGGGLAALNEDGTISRAVKMPDTQADLFAWFCEYGFYNTYGTQAVALLEKVRSSPQMGVVSAFTFGRGVGSIEMALTAAGIPFDEASPAKWQRAMGCAGPAARLGTKDKNITKRRAQALFPFATVTHAIADALLIAEFNRRTRLSLYTPQVGVTYGQSLYKVTKEHTAPDDGEHATPKTRPARRVHRGHSAEHGGAAR